MTPQKFLLTAAVAAFMAGAVASAPSLAAEAESQDPIKITLHDWTGQFITSKIMGEVLKSAGYNVEYVQADYLAQFAGLKTGDLTLAMEIWVTTGQEALDEAVATGKVDNLGETGMIAKEEAAVPDLHEGEVPGPAELGSAEGRGLRGRLLDPGDGAEGPLSGGPVTWGGFDEERVEVLDLPLEVVHAGTDAALFAELESAYQRKDPIVLWIYSPHWAPAKYEGEWVEFPPYEPACYTDPAWGINPDATHDCGKPTGPGKAAGPASRTSGPAPTTRSRRSTSPATR